MNPSDTLVPPQSFLAEAVSEEKATALEQLSAAWQIHITRLEEVLASGWRDHIGRVFDERFAELTERLDQRFASDLEKRVSEQLASATEAARAEERQAAEAALAAARAEGERRAEEAVAAALAAAREQARVERENAVASAREEAAEAARQEGERKAEAAVAAAVEAALAQARQDMEAAVVAAREQAAAAARVETESAVASVREEGERQKDAAVTAALESAREQARRELESAVASAREQAAGEARAAAEQEKETAVAAAREEAVAETRAQAQREYEANVGAACEEAARVAREHSEAELQTVREQAVRDVETAIARVRDEADLKMAAAVEAARIKARREVAEELNRSSRKLRHNESREEWAAALLDASSGFCSRAAVFTVRGQVLEPAAARGWENGAGSRLAGLEVPLAQSPAFGKAVSGRDTVVSLRNAGEVSQAISDLFGGEGDQKAWLVPVLQQDRVAAVLYAEGEDGSADLNGLEAVTALAAASLAPRTAVPRGMAAVASIGQRTTAAASNSDWSAMSSEEQDLHMKAQRFARVQVAELRLYKSQAVKSGRTGRNLYTVLRKEIDAARAAFEQQFISTGSSMIDYLHQELVRTLANDDVSVLGQNYPGPLV